MQVSDFMTRNAACCTPDLPVHEAAHMMVEHNCGAIPVVENKRSMRLVGILTDRDLACRIIAEDKNPHEMTVQDCMTSPAVTVSPETSLEACCKALEENQVRRLPVVDEDGTFCGIVTQAQIARHGTDSQIATVVKEVSRPIDGPSHVATL